MGEGATSNESEAPLLTAAPSPPCSCPWPSPPRRLRSRPPARPARPPPWAAPRPPAPAALPASPMMAHRNRKWREPEEEEASPRARPRRRRSKSRRLRERLQNRLSATLSPKYVHEFFTLSFCINLHIEKAKVYCTVFFTCVSSPGLLSNVARLLQGLVEPVLLLLRLRRIYTLQCNAS